MTRLSSRPPRRPSGRLIRLLPVAAALLAGVPFTDSTALANEGAKPGGGCPWAQDVSLEVNGKTLTLNQAVFATAGAEPVVIEPYQIYPMVDQLKLRIVGPKGREWEASLTRLVSGKRCSAFYVGKAFLVSDVERDPNTLILNR
ncbi:hypothetical protein J2847_003986 [Azospirillum agricola]|uniref:hypothetical protein n=1 Tax=Azospirillum agricola TaxID=1720247 RepID=UPI001B3B6447|nr:hypothetical protein [Azospirillum agricola]MBP2230681.1 hypothetical protein [Azospirillum agricola]